MPTNGNAVEKDLFHRSLEATQPSDLYIAGFALPCISGKKEGAQDGQGRGLLVFEGLKYIAGWKPHRARDQASEELVGQVARPDHGDDGEKPKPLAPEVTWKDMERWWQREEETKWMLSASESATTDLAAAAKIAQSIIILIKIKTS